MTGQLKFAFALSAGLHAGLLVGLPMTTPAEFDVERAPSSVEIVLLAPRPISQIRPQLEPAPKPAEPVAPLPDLKEPDPVTVITPQQRGALTEVLPGYLRNPPPVYPVRARQLGYEGTAMLEVEVTPAGRCGALRIARSSGHAMLDEAAASAIRRWRFKPARRGGVPVAVWVEIPVTFRLVNEEGS